ncbi:MAG: peptidase M22 [Clostridia bacterium]|nr:peptidase M22 [Clostridia bacterium]
MNKGITLGIDTSNYTTSVALIGEDGVVIANLKKLLTVKAGERGLRQSDAVFAHVKNLPTLMSEARGILNGRKIARVGVSTRPRNLDGSYMPCFLVGAAAAESISAAMNIPLYKYSHQCGHVMAALYSSGRTDLLDGRHFCAFHVSGGTTEMLRVCATDSGFFASVIGEAADLNAGQLIDRVGVMMGLSFPAGPQLERLALENVAKIPKKKPHISDFKLNLSGIENASARLYRESGSAELTAAFVLDHVADALSMLAEGYEEKFGKTEFVFAGGVMSNSIIKNKLSGRFNASFAEPAMSADNAVGIAALASREI